MALFAVTSRYEDAQSQDREANNPAHREWLAAGVAEGAIATVGPFVDGSGALLLVDADDDEAARDFVNRDPHCVKGLVSEITVRGWMPVYGALA